MKCKICGSDFEANHFMDEWQKHMNENQMCFNCAFWDRMLKADAKRPPHTAVVINGTHYVIEPDDPGNYFQGFGGAEFRIEFNDGHRVITHNLWCQGEPKGYWKDKFPDNAKFSDKKWVWKEIDGIRYLVDDNG